MAKNKALKKQGEFIAFDFSEGNDYPGDDAIAGMMNGLVEASNHQQMMAIELTKIVVQKSAEDMSEENIFSTFKRATKMVKEHFALKELWENFN
jgi:hypothetical protein